MDHIDSFELDILTHFGVDHAEQMGGMVRDVLHRAAENVADVLGFPPEIIYPKIVETWDGTGPL